MYLGVEHFTVELSCEGRVIWYRHDFSFNPFTQKNLFVHVSCFFGSHNVHDFFFFFCSFCVRECSFLCACASIIKIIQSPSPFPQKKSKQVQPLKGIESGNYSQVVGLRLAERGQDIAVTLGWQRRVNINRYLCEESILSHRGGWKNCWQN